MELLASDDEQVLVRWLRVLVAISAAALNQLLTVSDLPVLYKAPSPETMYSLLFGVEATKTLTINLLRRRDNSTEAKNLSSQLYKNVSLKSIVHT